MSPPIIKFSWEPFLKVHKVFLCWKTAPLNTVGLFPNSLDKYTITIRIGVTYLRESCRETQDDLTVCLKPVYKENDTVFEACEWARMRVKMHLWVELQVMKIRPKTVYIF